MNRPPECSGCRLNPETEGHDGETGGGYVPPTEVEAPTLIVVGMVPGGEEEQRQEVLVGPAGRTYSQPMNRFAAERRETKLNLVNCRTVKAGKTKDKINRDPTPEEVADCGKRIVIPLLRRLSDVPVFLLGGFVKKYLIPRSMYKGSDGHRLPLKPSDLADNLESVIHHLEDKKHVRKNVRNKSRRSARTGR